MVVSLARGALPRGVGLFTAVVYIHVHLWDQRSTLNFSPIVCPC
jgi:hypothetical protein